MIYTRKQWAQDIEDNRRLFSTLLETDKSIDIKYGVIAALLLWGLRNEEAQTALTEVMPDPMLAQSLTERLKLWVELEYDPRQAAKSLSLEAARNLELQFLLDVLISSFSGDLLRLNLLKPSTQTINLYGNLNAGNIVIGGTQYIAGDLIVQVIKPRPEYLCPTPPPFPKRFAGREAFLSQIIDHVRVNEKPEVIAITGAGGMGKTTITRMLAHRLFTDEKLFQAVLWADVTRISNVRSILNDWIVSYADASFNSASIQDVRQLAIHAKHLLEKLIKDTCEDCTPGRTLVVFDDVWESSLTDLRLLIENACPSNATILITTRSEKLAINFNATLHRLGRMDAEDATAMLREYLPEADGQRLRRLGHVLGGHALAMELAARMAKAYANRPRTTMNAVLEQLISQYEVGMANGTPLSTLKLGDGENRQDNLEVALSFSYNDLTLEDQFRFRALGSLAFDESFDLPLLAMLWECDLNEVEEHCDTLRTRSLLEVDERNGWYRQHPLLRTYAHALLASADEYDTVLIRYIVHAGSIADQLTQIPSEFWETLKYHLPHLLYVGDELVRQFQRQTLQTNLALLNLAGRFMIRAVSYVLVKSDINRMEWLQLGLWISQASETQALEAGFSLAIGILYSIQGIQSESLRSLQHALNLFRTPGQESKTEYQINAGRALISIGEAHQLTANWSEAEKGYLEALEIFRTLDQPFMVASIQSQLATVYISEQKWIPALEALNQSLSLMLQVNNLWGQAHMYNGIGTVYTILSEKDFALTSLHKARALYQHLGYSVGEAVACLRLGVLYFTQKEYETSQAHLAEALTLYSRMGSLGGKCLVIVHTAQIALDTNNLDQALEEFERALDLAELLVNPFLQSLALKGLRDTWWRGGDVERARAYADQITALEHALERDPSQTGLLTHATQDRATIEYYTQTLLIQQTIGDQQGQATALNRLGLVYATQGNQQQAAEYHLQALPLHRTLGNQLGEGSTLNDIGAAYFNIGKPAEALPYYQQALHIVNDIVPPRVKICVLNNLAVLHHTAGRRSQAIAWYKEVIAIGLQPDDSSFYMNALIGLGRVYAESIHTPESLHYYMQAMALLQNTRSEHILATVLSDIGSVYLSRGEFELALDHYRQSLTLFERCKDLVGEVRTLDNIASLLFRQQNFVKNIKTLKTIMRKVGHLDAFPYQASVLYNLARSYQQANNIFASLNALHDAIVILKRHELPHAANGLRLDQYEAFMSKLEAGIGLAPQTIDLDLGLSPMEMARVSQLLQEKNKAAIIEFLRHHLHRPIIIEWLSRLALPVLTLAEIQSYTITCDVIVKSLEQDSLRSRLKEGIRRMKSPIFNYDRAFFWALLRLLDGDRRMVLPPISPYAEHLKRVIQCIDGKLGK